MTIIITNDNTNDNSDNDNVAMWSPCGTCRQVSMRSRSSEAEIHRLRELPLDPLRKLMMDPVRIHSKTSDMIING